MIWDSHQANLKSDIEMVQKRALFGTHTRRTSSLIWRGCRKELYLGLTPTIRTSSLILKGAEKSFIWDSHQKNLKSDIKKCRKELPDASSMISANQLVPVPSSTDLSYKQLENRTNADKVSTIYKVMNSSLLTLFLQRDLSSQPTELPEVSS